jgi:HEAT repeat protein
MNARAKMTVAVLALTSAASATWIWNHHARGAAALTAPAPAATNAATAVESAPRLPVRRWRLGESFEYEITAARAVSVEGKGQGYDATLSAKLALTVVARDDQGITLRAEVHDPRFLSPSGAGRAAGEAMSKPFYVTAKESGELMSFSFATGTPAEVVGLLQGLVTSLQVVSPGLPLATWRATEVDSTGEYEAAYRRTATGVHKAKDAYLRARGATGLRGLPGKYDVSSSIDIQVGEGGWPSAVTETETLGVTVSRMRVISTNRTKATLAGVGMRPELVGAPNAAELQSEVASEAEGFARARKNAEQNLVAGRKYRAIAADFRAPELAKRNDAMVAMGALFRLDPGATAEAGEEILQGKVSGESLARTAAALGAAGTPEAQRVLGQIIASPNMDSSQVVTATVALGQSPHPIDENDEVLKKAMASDANDVASAAAFALGASIRARNAEGLGDTGGALQTLLDGLAQAKTDDERRTFLLALGNTGDPRALDAIEPYLASPSVELRIAAASALRFIPGKRADGDLVSALRDEAYLVRRAAVQAVEPRTETTVIPALTQMLHTEPQETVRLAIVSVIYPRLSSEPSVLDALQWAADSDPSQKVRNAAKQYLDPGK